MARVPDLVADSELRTEFDGSTVIHFYPEIDETGTRYRRKERWKVGMFLGGGRSGQVRLEESIRNNTQHAYKRAVKVIHKPRGLSSLHDFHRELEAIAKFSHDRYRRWFVKSFGWFEDPSSMFIAMEYCPHGDLHHYLVDNPNMPALEVRHVTYQILEGLDHMHQNNFAHRDLKSGNILIKSKPPEHKWWVVLADFGISKRADENNETTTSTKGTLSFMAPELLGYLEGPKPRTVGEFKRADIWALGEIVVRMLTGEHTFRSPIEVMRYCDGGLDFPSARILEFAEEEACEFLRHTMKAEPHGRSTSQQCLKHIWIKLEIIEQDSDTVEQEDLHMCLRSNEGEIADNTDAGEPSARWTRLSDSKEASSTTITENIGTKPMNRQPSAGSHPRILPGKSHSKSTPLVQAHESSTNNQMNAALPLQIHREARGGFEENPTTNLRCLLLPPKVRRVARLPWKTVLHEVMISPDGNWIMISEKEVSKCFRISIYNTDSWQLRSTHYGSCTAAFSPDSTRVAIVKYRGEATIEDLSSRRSISFKFPLSSVDIVVFPSNHIVTAVGRCSVEERAMSYRNLITDEFKFTSIPYVLDLASCLDSPYYLELGWLAMRSTDGNALLWDLQAIELRYSVSIQDVDTKRHRWFTCISPGGQYFVMQFIYWLNDYGMSIYFAPSGGLIKQVRGFTSICFSRDNTILALGNVMGTIEIWSQSMEPLRSFPFVLCPSIPMQMSFADGGKQLRVVSKKLLHVIAIESGSCSRPTTTPTDHIIISKLDDGKRVVWVDTEGLYCVAEF